MKKVILMILAVILAMPASAQEELRQDGLIFKLFAPEQGSKHAELIGNYLSEPTDVTVPSEVTKDGIAYPVTAIGQAFVYCDFLTSIIVPEPVSRIDADAFRGCSSLLDAILPYSVRNSKDSNQWFSYCKNLIKCGVPEDIYIRLDYTIQIIELPGKYVVAQDGVVFSNDKTALLYAPLKISGDYEIPGTVTQIGQIAFYKCSDMTSVTIPNSVTNIGRGAFNHCTGLTSMTIPESVTEFGNGAFYSCSGLTSVSIPNSVTKISANAFSGCTGLTSITIPESVTTFGSEAFSGCTGLTSMNIPESVTDLGTYTFNGCYGLTSINIPESLDCIGKGTFANCIKLSSVTIPNSVVTIGSSAFFDCIGLTSIDIPESVTYIGNGAFKCCFGLTSIDIPESVTYIGDSAFEGCYGLTSLPIPSSINRINRNTFASCDGLISVTIPESVTTISDCAFQLCQGLTSMTIPSTLTAIGQRAFYHCDKLKTLILPRELDYLGQDAFEFCSGLREIYYNTSEPISLPYTVFENKIYDKCTLYVANGGLRNARATDPWKRFVNIEEKEFVGGIEDVTADIDRNAPFEVFNIQGVKVADAIENLPTGLYIIRQGKIAQKVIVK